MATHRIGPERLERVYQALVAAAEAGERCPMNGEIADLIGANSTSVGTLAVKQLEAEGRITVRRGHVSRTVTITATGKSTLHVEEITRASRDQKRPRPAAERILWKAQASAPPPSDLMFRATTFLQRCGFVPVYHRIVHGKHFAGQYQVGREKLTGGELLALAAKKGFDADGWKQVAA